MKRKCNSTLKQLEDNFSNLNYPRIFKNHKKKAQEYIIRELSDMYKLKVTLEKSKFMGLLPVTCYNIESENDDYEIILTAHYDTHPLRHNFISSYLQRKIQLKPFSRLINNILYIISIIIVFFGTFLFSICTIFLFGLILYILHLTKYIPRISSNYNVEFGIALIVTIYYAIGIPFPRKAYIHDDNNSGISGIIYLAKLLHEKGYSSRVKLLFTDKEELGLLGAKAFINKNIVDLQDKKIINFDCIGRGTNLFIISKNNAPISQELHNHFLSQKIKTSIISVSCSDDKAFSNQKLNAAGILRADKDSKGNKLLFWVHTSHDTFENINIDYIIEIADTIADYIATNFKKI